ncbi:hypothetical protein [Lentibacillus sediminis]|uniref:hypothetical protein n=1 Tax=Lentibacillus sediminis TaxID=1940529 RepID=UPI000C1C53C2|nr:hypothetical protein [Lentibacillus sediminis]
MKKILTVTLSCLTVLLGAYLIFDKGHASPIDLPEYKVSFENAKLLDSKIDEDTGVQIDVYTLPNENFDKSYGED